MNNFTFDGVRFGMIDPETRTGSKHDSRLTKRSEEIATAAFVFARLGYSDVAFFTRDSSGTSLERPDFDAEFSDGSRIGIEIAQVGKTDRMRHDSQVAAMEHSLRDLCETDPAFAQAFGRNYVGVSTTGPLGDRDVASKKQALAMTAEVEAFVRARGHLEEDVGNPEYGYFGREYPTLHSRGATFSSFPLADGPHFSVITSGTVDPAPEVGEVIRVLDRHRESAHTYRRGRLWLLLYLPDTNEVFRGTIEAIVEQKPDIRPFEQCHITDAVRQIGSLP